MLLDLLGRRSRQQVCQGHEGERGIWQIFFRKKSLSWAKTCLLLVGLFIPADAFFPGLYGDASTLHS
jgi:hypothetical protein